MMETKQVSKVFGRYDPAEYGQQQITAVMAARDVVRRLIDGRDGGADED
jgi:hypothetical protein